MTRLKIQKVDIVEVGFLENIRFGFIEDKILRENLATNMQYVIFLYSLEREYELAGVLNYSVFKTIVVFTASIVESLLNYKLRQLIKEGELDESKVMGFTFEYVCFKKKGIPLSKKEVVVAGIKKIKKEKKLKNDTNFNELNKAAKKTGLFTKNLFEKADRLRKRRNEIHLTALGKTENIYPRKVVDGIFKDVKELIDRIRDYKI